MSLDLDALTREDCERARQWRNEEPAGLRTPYQLTVEQQADFYRDAVCNRSSPHRYVALRLAGQPQTLAGMGGLTFIAWENGTAEISLVVNPAMRDSGIGTQAVDALLEHAFNRLRLHTVYGECYQCNPAVEFWRRITEQRGGYMTTLPRRKFWDGRLWDSLYFSLARPE